MLSSLFFVTVLAAVAVRADPDPSEPGPGSVFNEGSTCHISWDPDTSGAWKTMNIELMCGDNYNMVHITTVATVDGTDATKTSYDYPCPQVTPNSPIYFYQFTSPDSGDKQWTTRFAIADSSGNVTPAANSTQPNGDQIPWGLGALVDSSTASPPPPTGAGDNTTTVPASDPGSSAAVTSAASSPSASLPGGFSPTVSNPAASTPAASNPAGAVPNSGSGRSNSISSSIKSSASAAATGAADSTNNTSSTNNTGGVNSGAAAGVSVNFRLTQAVATLAVVGAAFAVIF